MINPLSEVVLQISATVVEWAPKNWSSRESWGKDTPDGFYLTKSGELYRLSGKLVIYVTQEDMKQ